LAQRLLAYEAAADKKSKQTEPAAFRVFAKMRGPLISLAGVAGFSMLLSRALTLAKSEAPGLHSLHILPDGSLAGLEGLGSRTRKAANGEVVILIAHLIWLLRTLIGEGLTMRVVQDVWPEAAMDGHVFEKERKA
jgi:hypothetical protein